MFRCKKTWITSAHQGFVTEGIHSNTLAAYELAAQKGADMIETDARMTKDGVLIVNHDADIRGYDKDGNEVTCLISQTNYSDIQKISLLKENADVNRVPTLKQVLHIAYIKGMSVDIDLKEGIKHAEQIANLVVQTGMRGRTVYATNGAGAEAVNLILSIDPDAKFIDTKQNYTKEALKSVKDYPSKCFVYTGDFSDENIKEIRKSGCMLATISLNKDNAKDAFVHHPDMAEYPHTSDFEDIEKNLFNL